MSCQGTISVDSSLLVTLSGLLNASSGEYVDDADVTAHFLDEDGILVDDSGVVLTYVNDSDGDYSGTISDVVLTPGATYILEVTASQGDLTAGALTKTWRQTHVAEYAS